jgi:peptidylprolyl isomerase
MAFQAKTPPLLAVIACAALLASCGGGNSSPFASDSTVLAGQDGRPDVPIPVGPPPKKLVVVDLQKGSGRPAEDGDQLRVRYFNLAYRGHQIYEDNWSNAYGPVELGAGQLVEAWEEGLPGIKAGTRRVLVVPGGRETLGNEPEIYVVEAISVIPQKHRASLTAPGDIEKVPATGAKPQIAVGTGSPPRRFVARTLKRGSGSRVRRGDRLGARFMSFKYRTKEVQDFWGSGQAVPYHFVLGEGRLRKGWEITLPGQRLGTRLELLLPSNFAYGDGAMRYIVEILEREKRTPDREG